jgi:lipoyl(octanoyl) transferase
MSGQRWRLLVTPAAPGAENMALDEALMTRARQTDEWTLRVYAWSAPTISLGRNQSAMRHYDRERIRRHGLAVVRRPTGGRAILHHREITYSVTGPASHAGSERESYSRVTRLLVRALENIGVRATVARRQERARAPDATPCFERPGEGELTFEGRKLAGSAQWRSDGALLQHGSILVGDDQGRLSEFALAAQPDLPEPATLAQALGRAPSLAEAAEAFALAVRTLEDPHVESLELDDELRARTSSLIVQYSDDSWTWRR